MSHKEKKELKKKQKMEEEMARISTKGGQGHSDLGANFTVAQVKGHFETSLLIASPFTLFAPCRP